MIYKFKSFELDTDRQELRDKHSPVPIEPQVFALLTLLVTNSDRMISKEEMIERIWNGRVVSDSALSSRIKSLRQALGDDGKSQRLIRTIHGRGFRFIGEVVPAGRIDDAGQKAESSRKDTGEKAISRPAIAVLPFVNMSGDADQEYFSDAITQDIITNLSKHRWLDVTARNTSFGYKGQSINVRQLADELGVDYVVEGSVRRSRDRIRVTAQLADASTGNQRWSDRYDGDLQDVFAVQDEITAKIVARLEPEIGAAERQKVAKSVRRDLQAWECYHLGVYHFFKFTAAGNLEAQKMLQQSRDLDPDFGEAHAWWAYAVVLGMAIRLRSYWTRRWQQQAWRWISTTRMPFSMH
jgi:TolB-like protein